VSRFVLDNTVAMAWCFTEEATEFTKTLLSRLSNLTDNAVVPALWLYEVANQDLPANTCLVWASGPAGNGHLRQTRGPEDRPW